MLESRHVIVLQDTQSTQDNLVQELTKRDFAVRSCGSLSGFRHLYAMRPSPLVVLIGEPDDLACHTEGARLVAPAATIIAFGVSTDTNWRVRAMAVGDGAAKMRRVSWTDRPNQGHRQNLGRAGMARFLHQQSIHSHEPFHDSHQTTHNSSNNHSNNHSNNVISNSIHPGNSDSSVDLALASHPDRCSRLGSGWHLDANSRVLVCPQDQTLFLTGAENSFLMRIAASDGQLLRRWRPVNGVTQDVGHADSMPDARGMDVLVSRLRRKAHNVGIELPLLAVRACGYLFAEYLSVTPSRSMQYVARSPSIPSRVPTRVSTSAQPATNLSATRPPANRLSALSCDGLPGVAPRILTAVSA
jgi:DNA-binding response OmpR family regulator